jgi:hypothetical protein
MIALQLSISLMAAYPSNVLQRHLLLYSFVQPIHKREVGHASLLVLNPGGDQALSRKKNPYHCIMSNDTGSKGQE